jgi:selenophosphate synthetase-related protein
VCLVLLVVQFSFSMAAEAWAARLLAAAQGDAGALGGWRRVRDLSVLTIAPGVLLVVACDSNGGIGPKPRDTVATSGYELGRLAARVPLEEILACGATPILLIDTLNVEREPTGAAIIAGVRDEMRDAEMEAANALNGSTEDNVPTVATGVGIVVLGLAAEDRFRPGHAQAGDAVLCIGVPKSAPRHRVVSDDPEILRPSAVRALAALDAVRDILPVGSRGVLAEAHDLAASAGLTFVPDADAPIDLTASGGPGTCCVLAIPPAAVTQIGAITGLPPVARVGQVIQPSGHAARGGRIEGDPP